MCVCVCVCAHVSMHAHMCVSVCVRFSLDFYSLFFMYFIHFSIVSNSRAAEIHSAGHPRWVEKLGESGPKTTSPSDES